MQDMATETKMSPQTIYNFLRPVLSALNTAIKNSKYVHSLYIYFPKLDYVISPDKFYESELFYQNGTMRFGDSYEGWKSMLQNCDGLEIFEDGETVEVMLPVGDYDSYTINIIMKKEVIFQDVVSSYPNRSNVCAVLSGNGKLLFQYGLADNTEMEELSLEKELEISSADLGGRKMNVSYIPSLINRYRYIYASPTSEVSKGLQNIIKTNILSTFAIIILMLMLLYYFGRWNYKSLKSIIDDFKKNDDMSIKHENEYLLLSNLITSIRKEKADLEDDAQRLKSIQRNSFLTDYVKGRLDFSEIVVGFEKYDISFHDGNFALAAITRGQGEPDDTMYILIDDVIKNIADDSLHLLKIEMDEALYYIVNAPDNVDIKEDMRKLFSYALELVKNNFDFVFLTVMSTMVNMVEDIPKLYKETTAAIEHGIYYGIDEFIAYDEFENNVQSQFLDICRIPGENALLYTVKNRNSKDALKIIYNLLEQKVAGKYLQEWQLNCLTYNLINTIIQSLDGIQDDQIGKILEFTGKIVDCSNINELKKFFKDFVGLCIEYNVATSESEDNTYQKVKIFIDENITNSDLSSAWIGKIFDLSPTYILRLFKNHSGVKLNNYVNTRRMDMAKEYLMQDGKLKINTIAESVGFLNARTFLRIFKETEGVTPTQYRSLNK